MPKLFVHQITISEWDNNENGMSITSKFDDSYVLYEDDPNFWDEILKITFEDGRIKKEHWDKDDFILTVFGSSFNNDSVRKELNDYANDIGEAVDVYTTSDDVMYVKLFTKGSIH